MARTPASSGVEYQFVFTRTHPFPSTTGNRISSSANCSPAIGSKCGRSCSIAAPIVILRPLIVCC
jgi:hypothetical protein